MDRMKGKSARIDGKRAKMVRLFAIDKSFDSQCIEDLDVGLGFAPDHTLAGAPFAVGGYYVVIKALPKGTHVIKLCGTRYPEEITFETDYGMFSLPYEGAAMTPHSLTTTRTNLTDLIRIHTLGMSQPAAFSLVF